MKDDETYADDTYLMAFGELDVETIKALAPLAGDPDPGAHGVPPAA
jgi:hypothetical protein